jgi:hypothetical protein
MELSMNTLHALLMNLQMFGFGVKMAGDRRSLGFTSLEQFTLSMYPLNTRFFTRISQ